MSQYNADRQYALQAASLQQHSQQSAAGLASATANANANRASQSAMAQDAGSPSMRDTFQAAQQQSMLQQQGAQQQALQQQAQQSRMAEFTQGDKIRLAQMQAGKSKLQSDLDSHQITPEEFSEGMAQIQGVLGPLQLKQQSAKAQMLQQQSEEVKQQGALQAAHTKAIGQLLTDSPDGVKQYPDGSKLVFDGQKLHYHPPPKQEADPYSGDPTGNAPGSHSKAGGAGGATQFQEIKDKSLAHFVNKETGSYDKAGHDQYAKDTLKQAQDVADKEEFDHYDRTRTALQALAPNGDVTKLPPKQLQALQVAVAQAKRIKDKHNGWQEESSTNTPPSTVVDKDGKPLPAAAKFLNADGSPKSIINPETGDVVPPGYERVQQQQQQGGLRLQGLEDLKNTDFHAAERVSDWMNWVQKHTVGK